MGHALAGVLWLIVALALGQAVTWFGGWSVEGAPFAGALAIAALLGWAGNFMIGISYHLFPGFVGRARTALRFPSLTTAELSIQKPRPFILFAFNAGLIAIVVAFVFRAPTLGAGRRMARVGSSRPVRGDHLLDAEFCLPPSVTPSR